MSQARGKRWQTFGQTFGCNRFPTHANVWHRFPTQQKHVLANVWACWQPNICANVLLDTFPHLRKRLFSVSPPNKNTSWPTFEDKISCWEMLGHVGVCFQMNLKTWLQQVRTWDVSFFSSVQKTCCWQQITQILLYTIMINDFSFWYLVAGVTLLE